MCLVLILQEPMKHSGYFYSELLQNKQATNQSLQL